jgi:heme-degrading monooxygenase HmoA
MSTKTGPLVVINVFTAKPGALDDFLAMQIPALPGLGAGAAARGSRLYRAEDGSQALMLSVFDTAEDFKRFNESAALAAHRGKMQPFLERAEPGHYELVYQAGEV